MKTKSNGTFYGLPRDEAIARINRRNAESKASVERMPSALTPFGREIVEAAKRSTACQTQEQYQKMVEERRSRYRRLKPRKHTPSD